ncbi:MAG: lysophospholipid acyltransferase family protein [Chloroflexi bacterium]|nr:lysophospholipid acyltransferase family protein [Chloroflexota bacterium]
MSVAHRLTIGTLKALTRALCRIDDAQLERVPAHGPLILVTNHINIVEVPLLYTHLLPRPAACLVASVRWENPFYRWLLNGAQMIPLHRGEADIAALREGLRRLAQGWIVIIAPEGTRSHTGRLQRGKAGVVPLALRSGAPLLPLVFFGHEGFGDNVRRLRRTYFHIAVGQPFRLKPRGDGVTREVRQAMADEIMRVLAALLPPENRGVYANFAEHPPRYVAPLDAPRLPDQASA